MLVDVSRLARHDAFDATMPGTRRIGQPAAFRAFSGVVDRLAAETLTMQLNKSRFGLP
jgi:hypothetical protein